MILDIFSWKINKNSWKNKKILISNPKNIHIDLKKNSAVQKKNNLKNKKLSKFFFEKKKNFNDRKKF